MTTYNRYGVAMKILKTIGLGLLICIGYPLGYAAAMFIVLGILFPLTGWMFWYIILGDEGALIYLGLWFGCLIGFGVINAFGKAWRIVNGKDW